MPHARALVAGLAVVFAASAAIAQPRPSTPLSAAEVSRLIVGHSVALNDGGMTWFYNAGGRYDADDGRNGRSGTYAVRPNGHLCWTETTGVTGCFQYYRQGSMLRVRRVDAGRSDDLGAVTVGPLG